MQAVSKVLRKDQLVHLLKFFGSILWIFAVALCLPGLWPSSEGTNVTGKKFFWFMECSLYNCTCICKPKEVNMSVSICLSKLNKKKSLCRVHTPKHLHLLKHLNTCAFSAGLDTYTEYHIDNMSVCKVSESNTTVSVIPFKISPQVDSSMYVCSHK